MSIRVRIKRFLQTLFTEALAPAAPVAPKPVSVTFRATEAFLTSVRKDLMRPHPFAHERVGFITVRAAHGAEGLVLLAENYYPVADQDYVRNSSVGAMIGQEALRKALNLALRDSVGVFHAHMHGLSAHLWFSGIDLHEQMKFVPDFFSVCPSMPHGALVLDARSIAGRVWLASDRVTNITTFEIVGDRLAINRAAPDGSAGFYV